MRHHQTARLDLAAPTPDDQAELFALSSDPRLWRHVPSLRHADAATTAAMLERWARGWDRDGLGTWVARRRDEPRVIGYGGCAMLHDVVWNLGYRFDADEQGRGYATELAHAAVAAARSTRPDVPVIAYLLEHNTASAAVAVKVGLTLVDRGPDAGNPDPTAVRVVYADRPLSEPELAATRA